MVGWCGIYSRGCSRIRGNWSQDENVQLRGRSLWWLRPVKSRDARIAFGGEGLEDTRDPPGTFQGLSLPIYRRRTSQGRKGKISRRVLVKRECSRYGHWDLPVENIYSPNILPSISFPGRYDGQIEKLLVIPFLFFLCLKIYQNLSLDQNIASKKKKRVIEMQYSSLSSPSL